MPFQDNVFAGKVVHFTLARDARKHRPAIITRVRNNGTVDLRVMTTAIRFGTAFNIRSVVCDPTGMTPKTWHEIEFSAPRNVRTVEDEQQEAASRNLAQAVPAPATA